MTEVAEMTPNTAGEGSGSGVSFANDPYKYFNHSVTEMYSIPREELEALQLAALQYRFRELSETVPILQKMAKKQGINDLKTLNDVIPLLFEHTMYKSYPPSLLENGRFDKITQWLNKFTSHDLSGIDTSQCEGITDWVKLMDDQSPLKINHSSGTSGVMSFIPMSKKEQDIFGKAWPICYFQKFGDPAPDPEKLVPNVHVVLPGYRYGGNAFIRSNDQYAKYVAGSEERVHTLYPGRLDSDVLFLAARIHAARNKGTLDSLQISPQLLARQKEFEDQRKNMAADVNTFFEGIVDTLRGQQVFALATWSTLYDMAKGGLERGIRSVFAPDSIVIVGGGAKGMVRPDDWKEPICEFFGVPRLTTGYAMSEVSAVHVLCDQGHYHISPSAITFVLDPDTSEPLPRVGTVTGRAAYYDLLAESRWGGFITGDEITVHWDGDCSCGRTSAYIEDNIERYSEKRGGDDKISCAATPEAHREAMDFLTRFDRGNEA